MFEEFTKRKKPIPEKLTAYGFEKEGNMFRYSREIRDGEFTLTLEIGKDGAIGTELIEKETGEEYVLYKTNASGAYVGGIRAAIGEVVGDVTGKCYETSVFRTEQAQMLREFVRETYGDELEFLWTQFPDNARLAQKGQSEMVRCDFDRGGQEAGARIGKNRGDCRSSDGSEGSGRNSFSGELLSRLAHE